MAILFLSQDPEIIDFSPRKGPQSGGTLLTIKGHSLNAGSSVAIVLTNGTVTIPCEIVERTNNAESICITRPSISPFDTDVLEMTMDLATVKYSQHVFSFIPDPVIESVLPGKSIFRYEFFINVICLSDFLFLKYYIRDLAIF